MPGFLLHVGATVLCAHGGQASPTAPSPRVKVGGQPVTTHDRARTRWPAARSRAAGTPQPCVTAQWMVGGDAGPRRRPAGAAIQDSQAVCAPNGTPVTRRRSPRSG